MSFERVKSISEQYQNTNNKSGNEKSCDIGIYLNISYFT